MRKQIIEGNRRFANVQAHEWDSFRPDAGYYGTKLWEHPSTLTPDGWFFVNLPVRYALGWMDLLNRQEKEAAMPDRDTLMAALDQLLTSFPERDPEGQDLPLNLVWDAVTYIESLHGTLENLKNDNDTYKARNQRLMAEISNLRESLAEYKRVHDADVKRIVRLQDEDKHSKKRIRELTERPIPWTYNEGE